ncbi:Transmembrane protein [Toxocara canis]|uniref:Transmembrane protein n=1 Tax=Toxocara canis TaxID=6265 RepID=A0A0B2UZ80_TOXCA|nr:Transmembrane protein [Toxocara canis]
MGKITDRIFDRNTLLINVGLLGCSLFLPIYSMYNITVFTNKFKISPSHMSLVQVLFMIWNAINDPLFGFAQDVGCGVKWIMSRRKVMLYAGPAFAFSFLLFWFPWTSSEDKKWLIGVQYFVALFIHDSLLTLVLSAYCAMCVEIGDRQSDRIRAVVYSEITSLIGSFIIYPFDMFSRNLEDFETFQWLTIIISFISAGCYVVTGKFSRDGRKCVRNENESANTLLIALRRSLSISWEVIRERSFLCVVFGQFFRMMRSTVNDSFMIVFVQTLISPYGVLPLGSRSLSIFYVLCRTIPQVIFVALWPFSNRFGAWIINTLLGCLTIINCIIALTIGSNQPFSIAIFIMIENFLSRCGQYTLYTLFVGEAIDDDMRINKRKSPMSTVLFTLKALLNKPAEQLSPILVLFVLNQSGYFQFIELSRWDACKTPLNGTVINQLATAAPRTASLDDAQCNTLLGTIFAIATIFPLVCTVLEMIIMSAFNHRLPKTNNSDGKLIYEQQVLCETKL